jgi:hypothetical protein
MLLSYFRYSPQRVGPRYAAVTPEVPFDRLGTPLLYIRNPSERNKFFFAASSSISEHLRPARADIELVRNPAPSHVLPVSWPCVPYGAWLADLQMDGGDPRAAIGAISTMSAAECTKPDCHSQMMVTIGLFIVYNFEDPVRLCEALQVVRPRKAQFRIHRR